jgi:hypothetical protein
LIESLVLLKFVHLPSFISPSVLQVYLRPLQRTLLRFLEFHAKEVFIANPREPNWLFSLGKTSLAWLCKAKQKLVAHLMDHVG